MSEIDIKKGRDRLVHILSHAEKIIELASEETVIASTFGWTLQEATVLYYKLNDLVGMINGKYPVIEPRGDKEL